MYTSATLQEALVQAKRLEIQHQTLSAQLNAVPGASSGPLWLTPDSVKAKPEWQRLKRETDEALYALQSFNRWYVKKFAKELREWRRGGGRYSDIKLPDGEVAHATDG